MFSPSKIAPSHGICTPSDTWFLGSTRLSIQNGISIGSATFAQMTAECPYPSLLKIATSYVIRGPPSNAWFLGHTRVLGSPNGISIGSAVFSGLTSLTDRRRYTRSVVVFVAFSALTLLVGRQEGHPACKKWGMVEVGTG